MAVAWTSLPDGDVDPESPITTALMVALRDNPEGIAGAAGGAPKIITGAITDLAVTTAKLAAGEQMTTANVAGVMAGVAADAVGSYALAGTTDAASSGFGDTKAGSGIEPVTVRADSNSYVFSGTGLTGTWRCMGLLSSAGPEGKATLWLRTV